MKNFMKVLEKDIEELHLSKHPFYVKWNNGQVPVKALQEYAREYYQFVDLFPRLVSRIHSNTEDQADRFMILDNLNEEEDPKELHADLWVDFAQGLGMKRKSLNTGAKLKETKQTIDTLKKLCENDPLEGAAAALAYESQISEIADLKADGLKKHYNIKDAKTLKFFKVHGVVDIEHQKTWKKMIKKHAKTDAQQQKVRKALRKSLKAMNLLLDGVDKHYC